MDRDTATMSRSNQCPIWRETQSPREHIVVATSERRGAKQALQYPPCLAVPEVNGKMTTGRLCEFPSSSHCPSISTPGHRRDAAELAIQVPQQRPCARFPDHHSAVQLPARGYLRPVRTPGNRTDLAVVREDTDQSRRWAVGLDDPAPPVEVQTGGVEPDPRPSQTNDCRRREEDPAPTTGSRFWPCGPRIHLPIRHARSVSRARATVNVQSLIRRSPVRGAISGVTRSRIVSLSTTCACSQPPALPRRPSSARSPTPPARSPSP